MSQSAEIMDDRLIANIKIVIDNIDARVDRETRALEHLKEAVAILEERNEPEEMNNRLSKCCSKSTGMITAAFSKPVKVEPVAQCVQVAAIEVSVTTEDVKDVPYDLSKDTVDVIRDTISCIICSELEYGAEFTTEFMFGELCNRLALNVNYLNAEDIKACVNEALRKQCGCNNLRYVDDLTNDGPKKWCVMHQRDNVEEDDASVYREQILTTLKNHGASSFNFIYNKHHSKLSEDKRKELRAAMSALRSEGIVVMTGLGRIATYKLVDETVHE